jgi:CBS domain-containing protein
LRIPDAARILASVDVRGFVRGFPPFDALDEATISSVLEGLQIEFFPAGTAIGQQPEEGPEYAYMVRAGAVELLEDGRIVDLLHPGEVFGRLTDRPLGSPTLTARAQEDTLCYLVRADVMRGILAARAGLAFLSAHLRDRTARALIDPAMDRVDPWRRSMESLLRRSIVGCAPTTTIRAAAELMAEERVSSLLIRTGQGWGIVTDRDLRTRVIAQGRSVEGPVGEIASQPVATAKADATAADGLRLMLERGIHHLPVERAGRILGMVTDSDLLGLERRAPFRLRSDIERAADRHTAIAAGRLLPAAVMDLVDARMNPVDIGHVVGVTVDALTHRLAELAIEDLGEPPAPWAWIALGSQARHEQALRTDQDHAIAFGGSEGGPDAEAYFNRLAERVTSGIEEMGIPRCRAGVSATSPQWRAGLDEWARRFAGWMADAGPDEAALTAIAFDYRRVTGTLDVEGVLDDVVRTAPAHPLFLRRLAAQAIALRPPTGFIRDFVVEARGERAGTLDIKHGGLTAITSIARTLALRAGAIERRTLDRLRQASAQEHVEEHDRVGLEEAFQLLWQVRLEHQVDQARRGQTPDDHVDPKKLGPVTRQGVKAAFRAVDGAQRMLALEFDLHRV